MKQTAAKILLMIVSIAVVFGGGELIVRTFYAERVRTYFDEQTQAALGKPVPPKEPGEYRIFIFGGSAAYGFPLADRYSITAWLRKSFPHLLPDKKVRVINTAWPGKGSHYVLEGAINVMKYKPDLFIIYSGHNEFPVANRLYVDNWFYWLNLRLKFRSAAYRLLSIRINRVRKHIVYGHSGYAEKQYRDEVIANKVYKEIEITDEEYQRLLKRYRENMENVIKRARRHGVDVLFVTLPANLRDIPPSFSMHRPELSENELRTWQEHFDRGVELSKHGQYKAAIDALKQASAIDPDYAELQYKLGLSYEQAGNYEDSKKALTLARDLDGRPWRAKSSLNDLVREIARRHNLILVDLVKVFEEASPLGIVGNSLVYDNVHPSASAQLLIADEICSALAKNGKIASTTEWQWDGLERSRQDKENPEWKMGSVDAAHHYVLRAMHLWELKRYEEAVPDLEKGVELMPDFIELYGFLGDVYWHLGEREKAREAFQTFDGRNHQAFEATLQKYPEIQQSYIHSAQALRSSASGIR